MSQCQCGAWIRNPVYTSKSKYDGLCDECRGYENTYDLPPSGEELLMINLENYQKDLSGDENG